MASACQSYRLTSGVPINVARFRYARARKRSNHLFTGITMPEGSWVRLRDRVCVRWIDIFATHLGRNQPSMWVEFGRRKVGSY
jgi:hypothetical protein